MEGKPMVMLLWAALGLLLIDAVLELALITSMVSWLHRTAHGTLTVRDNGATFELAWKPAGLMVDQGHASNGAAGTALVIVSLGGTLVLFLRERTGYLASRASVVLYRAWLVLSVLAMALTTAALAYVFAVSNAHAGQTIDVSAARGLRGGDKYPLEKWTPQGWFAAVLKLEIEDGVRGDIARHLRLMRGWQYNLIPLFLIQLVATTLVVLHAVRRHRERPTSTEYSNVKQRPPV